MGLRSPLRRFHAGRARSCPLVARAARAARRRLLHAQAGKNALLHAEPRLHSDVRPRRHGTGAARREPSSRIVGAAVARASPPRQPTPESRWALLRRDGVLDLRSAVARALLRCVAAFHRRKSVGAWTGTKLEVLSRARAAPGRTERVRLRRRVGGTAHARAWRRR